MEEKKNTAKVSLSVYIATVIVLLIIIYILAINLIDNATTEITEEIVADTIDDTYDNTDELLDDVLAYARADVILNSADDEETGNDFYGNPDIYYEGELSNELMLKIAWDTIISEAQSAVNALSLDGYSADGVEITKVDEEDGSGGSITISQEKMAETISEIFGSNTTYVDESFDNSAIENFEVTMYPNVSEDGEDSYVVNYEDEEYVGYYVEGGERSCL